LQDDLEVSRRMAAIGRLTAGVGHEVKNPINAIVVHVELLRHKLNDGPLESQKHIEVIGSEVQRLNRVVQTLVDFSRPVDLRLHDYDLRQVVFSIADLETVALQARGVELKVSVPQQPLIVHADADMIKQAVLNLVHNAADAMPDGGAVSVTVTRVGREAKLTVTDEGSGIPRDQMDKIFNLYFTTKATGTGIGLAMTYRIMQLHKGKIDVESTEGKGSTFTLQLPLAAESRRAPVKA
jgi:signal transduction histidine kinase